MKLVKESLDDFLGSDNLEQMGITYKNFALNTMRNIEDVVKDVTGRRYKFEEEKYHSENEMWWLNIELPTYDEENAEELVSVWFDPYEEEWMIEPATHGVEAEGSGSDMVEFENALRFILDKYSKGTQQYTP